MIRLKDVNHRGVTDLASDMAGLPPKIARDSIKTVRDGIRVGNALAKANARRTSGSHGKHHHRAYSAEMHGLTQNIASQGFTYSGEYGPDAGKPQGGMSFEEGSRNQRPHRPLGRTIPMVAPAFHAEYARKIDGWFW